MHSTQHSTARHTACVGGRSVRHHSTQHSAAQHVSGRVVRLGCTILLPSDFQASQHHKLHVPMLCACMSLLHQDTGLVRALVLSCDAGCPASATSADTLLHLHTNPGTLQTDAPSSLYQPTHSAQHKHQHQTTPHPLPTPVCNDLVCVHVALCAAASLPDDKGEVAVQLPL